MGILNTITKALGLDNTKKTPKEPTRIPKTVQDSIPYLGAYENGIIREKVGIINDCPTLAYKESFSVNLCKY